MARLGRILNALIIFLGARIIWQEWRNPASGGTGETGAGAGDAGAGVPKPAAAVEPAAGTAAESESRGGAGGSAGAPSAPGGATEEAPTDGAAAPAAPAATTDAGPGDTESVDPARTDDSGLAERQSVAAEARFSPAFPTEIEGEVSLVPGGATSGAGVEIGPGEESDAAEGEAPASAAAPAEMTWAGVPAADAPTARDLDLATPLAPSSGPTAPAGAIVGDGTSACPVDHPIKGNASSMIYHQPGQPSYERTVAEYCFTSAEAAEAAGYRAPRR